MIVASGYSKDPILANHKEYGFCGSLIKPFELKEIEALIDQLFA